MELFFTPKAKLTTGNQLLYVGIETIGIGISTAHLQVSPKTPTSYKFADLWVDANGMPVKVIITEQNNNTTTVLLSNIKKNVSLDGKIFKLNYPNSVKKIRA